MTGYEKPAAVYLLNISPLRIEITPYKAEIQYSPPEISLQGVAAWLRASNDLRFQLLLSKKP